MKTKIVYHRNDKIFLGIIGIIAILALIGLVWGLTGCAPRPFHAEKVTDNIYRSQMPTDAQIKSLKESGFRNYLNLMDINSMYDRSDVLHLNKEWGEGFVNEPMSNWTRPKKEALIRAANLLHEWDKRGEKSLVTCRWGHDRTGEVVGTFEELYLGYSLDRAYKEMINHGHNVLVYESWFSPFCCWRDSLKEIEQESK